MCSDAPSPDPQIGQAAMANADIARQALQYFKDKDAAQAPRQARMDDLTEKLIKQQMGTSAFNDEMARDQFLRYQAKGVPAEDAMYADAANYDSKDQRDQAAGQAATDVDTSMSQAADAQRRQMARMGVNPADGRSLAMEQDTATQGALAKAGAMNKARTDRQNMGIMLRKDAASFARGMPGSAAQTFGTAMAAGGQASGAAGAAIGAANQTAGTMGTGFGLGIQGNNSAGSILNQEYRNNIDANSNAGLAAGIGGIAQGIGAAGGVGAFFSDENMKEDVAPFDEKAALDGVSKTRVKSWQYKPGSPADDGGQQHVGAMAQDLHKHLGDTVAPGGKMVDPVSAIGATMAAVKALNKKVDRIAAKGVKR